MEQARQSSTFTGGGALEFEPSVPTRRGSITTAFCEACDLRCGGTPGGRSEYDINRRRLANAIEDAPGRTLSAAVRLEPSARDSVCGLAQQVWKGAVRLRHLEGGTTLRKCNGYVVSL